jgi:hypothetical protein
LRRLRSITQDQAQADAAIAAADKIEDYLVGNITAPIQLTEDESLPFLKNLEALRVGAIKSKDKNLDRQLKALWDALDQRNSRRHR